MRIPFKPKLVQSKEEINPNPAQVGKAAYNILSQSQPDVEVGEILEEYAHSYVKELEDTVSKNKDKYFPPLYIIVFYKKEFWAVNVQRQWFVARQTCPKATFLIDQYPNFGHTVYSYDKRTDEIKVLWSLPGWQEMRTIAEHPDVYDPILVEWVLGYFNGILDREAAESDSRFKKVS